MLKINVKVKPDYMMKNEHRRLGNVPWFPTIALLTSLDWFPHFIYLIFNFCNAYLFLRKTASVSSGGAKRECDKRSEVDSALTAEPRVGLKLTNHEIMT